MSISCIFYLLLSNYNESALPDIAWAEILPAIVRKQSNVMILDASSSRFYSIWAAQPLTEISPGSFNPSHNKLKSQEKNIMDLRKHNLQRTL